MLVGLHLFSRETTQRAFFRKKRVNFIETSLFQNNYLKLVFFKVQAALEHLLGKESPGTVSTNLTHSNKPSSHSSA